MKTVTCPGCGAPATVASLRAGECGYCHAALVKPPPPPGAPRPIVNIHVQGPSLDATGDAVAAVGTRAFGCLSGCITTGFTFAFMALIFAFVAFQIHAATPPPPPAPHVAPAPQVAPVPHPKSRKSR